MCNLDFIIGINYGKQSLHDIGILWSVKEPQNILEHSPLG